MQIIFNRRCGDYQKDDAVDLPEDVALEVTRPDYHRGPYGRICNDAEWCTSHKPDQKGKRGAKGLYRDARSEEPVVKNITAESRSASPVPMVVEVPSPVPEHVPISQAVVLKRPLVLNCVR